MKTNLIPAFTTILLSIFSVSLKSARANIVDMGSFNLPIMTLINKYDFSYGDADGEDDLDEAAIRFDLAFVPQMTNPNETYAFIIIAADADMSNELVSRLRNGTQQATSEEHGVTKRHIQWIEDVQEIIYPIRNNFTVYEKFTVDGDKNATWTYYN